MHTPHIYHPERAAAMPWIKLAADGSRSPIWHSERHGSQIIPTAGPKTLHDRLGSLHYMFYTFKNGKVLKFDDLLLEIFKVKFSCCIRFHIGFNFCFHLSLYVLRGGLLEKYFVAEIKQWLIIETLAHYLILVRLNQPGSMISSRIHFPLSFKHWPYLDALTFKPVRSTFAFRMRTQGILKWTRAQVNANA